MKSVKAPVAWGWSRAAGARAWRSARRRWLMGGVLAALVAAVLAPRLGAPGGGLRAEYTAWALVSYVHFSAGRRARGGWLREQARGVWLREQARALVACVAHAHLVSPALTAALISALTDGVDYRIVQGVMMWSLGGGCAWLPLALSARGAAAGGCAFVYAASLLATPLHTALLCGRAALPVLGGVLVTLGTAAAPFAAGAWLPLPSRSTPGRALGVQLAALALLYAECCERLCDAEAILYLSDVLVAFALEVCCVLVSAAWCALYARVGVLSRSEARLVALCALPRSLDTRWSMACAARGMCRLPGVFAGPTQALLLAAQADSGSDSDPDDADVLPRDAGKLLSVAS